jgi:hypothetical protein
LRIVCSFDAVKTANADNSSRLLISCIFGGDPVVPYRRFGIVATLFAAPLLAQQSPPAETSVTIAGKVIRINYSAPSMRGRKIFGGLEPYNHVWRAGANDATALHTDANLEIGGLSVPKGDYTLFVYLDPKQWQLIVSKQTGEWGLDYDKSHDLGRVNMEMSKPPKPIETYKMTLSSLGANKGKLQLAWENTIAEVPIAVK